MLGQSDDSEPCHTNRVTVIISLSSSQDGSGPEPELLGEYGKIEFGATEVALKQLHLQSEAQ